MMSILLIQSWDMVSLTLLVNMHLNDNGKNLKEKTDQTDKTNSHIMISKKEIQIVAFLPLHASALSALFWSL